MLAFLYSSCAERVGKSENKKKKQIKEIVV